MESVKPPRNATLDVLRGVAILLVLGRHQAYTLMPQHAGALKPLADVWFQIGWIGVDLFFVLSGFLVGGLLIKEGTKSGKIDAKRFLTRRLMKIWPQYLIYATFALVTAAASYGPVLAARNMWPNFFHIQNYRLTPEHHLWSLAVEEHFYLLLTGFLVWLFTRVKAASHWKTMLATYIGLATLTFVLRFKFAGGYDPKWAASAPTHFRIDCLFLGVLLAFAWQLQSERIKAALNPSSVRMLLLALALALASPVYFISLEDKSNFIPIYGFLLLSFASVITLITCYANDLLRGKFWGALKFVGFYSYGIYLWHVKCRDLAVEIVARLPLPPNFIWLVGMVLFIALSIGAGIITTKLIELPMLRLREKIAA